MGLHHVPRLPTDVRSTDDILFRRPASQCPRPVEPIEPPWDLDYPPILGDNRIPFHRTQQVRLG